MPARTKPAALTRLVGACGVAWCVAAPTAVWAEELRDPFTFGARKASVKRIGSPAVSLNGILWDATHPLAIVGDETVAVGDRVAGWKVVEIREDGMAIERDGRREFVSPGNTLPAD